MNHEGFSGGRVANNAALRLIFKVCAVLCVALGLLGVVLPLLPTTPFLLLAVFFSLRSSPTIYGWLINHATFGPPLRCYLEERSISPGIYRKAVTVMWSGILFSAWLVKPLILKGMLLTIAVAVTFYMTRLMKRGRTSHAIRQYKNH